MNQYDVSGTPTWEKIIDRMCMKAGCNEFVSERGLCYNHEESCHVPACDEDVYRTDEGDGFCGEHEGKCWKPNCPNPVYENGSCQRQKGNVKNWSVKLRSFQVNIARCTAMSAGNHIAKILRQSADFA